MFLLMGTITVRFWHWAFLLYYAKIYYSHNVKKNVPSDMCVQRRLKSAGASAQSDQSLRCPHGEISHPWLSKMTTLIRLRECHYENTPIQIYRKYHLQKLKNFK